MLGLVLGGVFFGRLGLVRPVIEIWGLHLLSTSFHLDCNTVNLIRSTPYSVLLAEKEYESCILSKARGEGGKKKRNSKKRVNKM